MEIIKTITLSPKNDVEITNVEEKLPYSSKSMLTTSMASFEDVDSFLTDVKLEFGD